MLFFSFSPKVPLSLLLFLLFGNFLFSIALHSLVESKILDIIRSTVVSCHSQWERSILQFTLVVFTLPLIYLSLAPLDSIGFPSDQNLWSLLMQTAVAGASKFLTSKPSHILSMGCNSRDIEGNGLLQLVPEDRKKLHTVSLFLSHPQAP